MKILVKLIFLFTYFTANLAVANDTVGKPIGIKVITFDYPPFIHQTPVDGHKGLEVEIFEAALKGLQTKLSYKFFPILRAIWTFKKNSEQELGAYIGTSVHLKKEISESKYYSLHIGQAQFVAYVRKGSKLDQKSEILLEDLKTVRVAAPSGSSVVNALKAAGIDPMLTNNFEQLFMVVDKGRVEVSVVLDIAGDSYLSKHQTELSNTIQKKPSKIFVIPLNIVVAKNLPDSKTVYEHLKSRLAKMRQNGELKEIAQYYYGKTPVPSEFLADGD